MKHYIFFLFFLFFISKTFSIKNPDESFGGTYPDMRGSSDSTFGVYCSVKEKQLRVISELNINCTIHGKGGCYDYKSGSSCISPKHSIAQCITNSNEYFCNGVLVECYTSKYKCELDRSGNLIVNGIIQENNFAELVGDFNDKDYFNGIWSQDSSSIKLLSNHFVLLIPLFIVLFK